MRINRNKPIVRSHVANAHITRFGVNSIGSNAEQAMTLVGQSFPIAKGSTEMERIVHCQPNPSGVSCWFTLLSGIRVCVQYKDWKPILYVTVKSK